jgi:hypothetical protein
MIVATRTLKLRASTNETDVSIAVLEPEVLADGSWRCRYSIGWPDGIWESHAGGIDSMQALFGAMKMIGSEIYTSEYHKSGNLYMDQRGAGYGFPVPRTLRDLLIGDDKKFF